MSYDTWIEMPDPDMGPEEPVILVEIGNHTSNTSRMWHWAYAQAVGRPEARIQETDRRPVAEVAEDLTKAYGVMAINAEMLRQWNPPNGWGTYESALSYLGDIAEACNRFRKVPDAVLRWDW